LLSESLALHLLGDGVVLEGLRGLRLGGRHEADIVGRDLKGRDVKFEIKGTGANEWVYLGEKDYPADYLLWVSFGSFFEDSDRELIELHIFRPSAIGGSRQRITLRTLSQLPGVKEQSRELDLVSYLRT
jgi:hypothetical protein